MTITVTIGMLLGLLFFYIPKKYYTTGSLYITRKVSTNEASYYSYDGYYSQQVALSYTNTVLATLESKDILSKSLNSMAIDINDKNLRKYKNNIEGKKEGPQMITFTVKGNTKENTEMLWNNLIKETTEKLNLINADSGDKNISINKLVEKPVTVQLHYPLYICLIFGSLIMLFINFMFLTFKTYLKENTK